MKIRDAPDTDLAGYPAGRISGLSESRKLDIKPDTVSGGGRIPDIRPDFQLNLQMTTGSQI
jgi:hypothetical protein